MWFNIHSVWSSNCLDLSSAITFCDPGKCVAVSPIFLWIQQSHISLAISLHWCDLDLPDCLHMLQMWYYLSAFEYAHCSCHGIELLVHKMLPKAQGNCPISLWRHIKTVYCLNAKDHGRWRGTEWQQHKEKHNKIAFTKHGGRNNNIMP
jgi:hypothetical protein